MTLKSKIVRSVRQWPITRWAWGRLDDLSEFSTRGLSEEQLHLANKSLLELLESSPTQSVVSCVINGHPMRMPIEVLRMFPHCLRPRISAPLNFLVEPKHTRWICNRLSAGEVVFDIGASIGIVTTSLSHAVGPDGKVFSFEPSRTAATKFDQVIALNHLDNVTLVPKAVADRAGSLPFTEYLPTESDVTWVAEASTLGAACDATGHKYIRYEVPVTTIDQFVEETGAAPQAIKIDIEGFELDALRGGKQTLERCHPTVCIDIHANPRGGGTMGPPVTQFMRELGYRTTMNLHVMLCEHPHGARRARSRHVDALHAA